MKNASEEVLKLFGSKSSSSASSPESTLAVPESTSACDVAGLRHELTQLKQNYAKANEVGVVSTASGHSDCVCVCQEMAGLKGRVSELSRRLEDATRAYQQERRVSYIHHAHRVPMVMCCVDRRKKREISR